MNRDSDRRRAALRRALPLLLPLLLAACSALRRPAPPIDRSEDPRIQREVEARLAREPSLRGRPIRVEVDGGVVLLHGSVAGIGGWQCALTNAELVPGVRTVVDYLVLERGPRDVTCLAPRPDLSGGGDPGGGRR